MKMYNRFLLDCNQVFSTCIY